MLSTFLDGNCSLFESLQQFRQCRCCGCCRGFLKFCSCFTETFRHLLIEVELISFPLKRNTFGFSNFAHFATFCTASCWSWCTSFLNSRNFWSSCLSNKPNWSPWYCRTHGRLSRDGATLFCHDRSWHRGRAIIIRSRHLSVTTQ